MTKTVMDVDYGPLQVLIGTWEGDKGMDVAPEPDGIERSPYFETITFEAAGDVTNAEEQKLAIVRYYQAVFRKSNGEQFHDQIGYWLWDPASGTVMQTLAIPRGVTLLAGGRASTADGGAVALEVRAALGDADWGIVQSPFMRDKASTVAFKHKITVDGDSMRYAENTSLNIYGRDFDHTDVNTLKRRS